MKNKIRIPTTFELGGRTWKVIAIKRPALTDAHISGQTFYDFNYINMFSDTHGHKMPQETLETTYLHEVLHAVLFEMNYNALSNDEDFVDRIAKALHQVLTTSQGVLAFKESV